MRIQHPKATDSVDGWPASAIRLPHANRVPIEDGYVDVPDDHADGAIAALEDAYGVTYDDDGTVLQEGVPPDKEDVDDTDADTTESDGAVETCDTVKNDGEVCGRELPCPYHTDTEDN